jgi:hypothetical protein
MAHKKLISDEDRKELLRKKETTTGKFLRAPNLRKGFRKHKQTEKDEAYENPYFGKKKPTGISSRTWDVTKNYRTKKKGGRTGKQFGGRTNLLEELGRVEGEPSNRNRRAEISRVHGELNRGYKHGKRVGLKGGGSAGPVLKNKKVGIQTK